MNVREVTKILFKIRSNLIDPKQKTCYLDSN